MTEFVLDCSVAIAWVFDDQASDATDALLRDLKDGGRAVVPPLLHLELGNVLVQAERRRPSRRGHCCAPPLTDPSVQVSRTRFLT